MLTCTSFCRRGKSKASGRLSPQKTALSSQTGANKQIASRAIKPNPEEDLRRDVPCLCPDEADPCEKLMANTSVWVATCVTLVRHLNTRSPTRRIKKRFVSPVQSSFPAKSPLVYRKETKKKNNNIRTYQTGGDSFDLPQHAWKEPARSSWTWPRCQNQDQWQAAWGRHRVAKKRLGNFWKYLKRFGTLHGNLGDSTKHYEVGIIQTKVTQFFNMFIVF